MPINEKHTHQTLIDEQLVRAGWNVSDPTQVIQEFHTYGNPGDQGAAPSKAYDPAAP